jgi:hypothetical protein
MAVLCFDMLVVTHYNNKEVFLSFSQQTIHKLLSKEESTEGSARRCNVRILEGLEASKWLVVLQEIGYPKGCKFFLPCNLDIFYSDFPVLAAAV